jgi:hypothetical protein
LVRAPPLGLCHDLRSLIVAVRKRENLRVSYSRFKHSSFPAFGENRALGSLVDIGGNSGCRRGRRKEVIHS